jgi:TPR repeat protein
MQFTLKLLILIALLANVYGCAGLYNCSRITNNPSAFQECQAKNGNQDAQYEMGRIAFDRGDTNTAIKWLKKAAKDTPEIITGFRDANNDSGFIVTQERTGNVKRGHYEARMLLIKIYEEGIRR